MNAMISRIKLLFAVRKTLNKKMRKLAQVEQGANPHSLHITALTSGPFLYSQPWNLFYQVGQPVFSQYHIYLFPIILFPMDT